MDGPGHSLHQCLGIDTMLNVDGDANADVKCEQALNLETFAVLLSRNIQDVKQVWLQSES